MPKIERTERAVRIDPKPYPSVSGDGAKAIGEGISSLGSALSGLAAKQDEQEMFDTRMKVSEYTFREAKELDDRVANYNPAVHGTPDEFDRTYEAERAQRDQAFVGQFKSKKAQQYAMAQAQTARQSSVLRAQNARQGFVQQENIGRVMAHAERIGMAGISGDPESVVDAHKALEGSIDAVPGLTPAQRNALRAKGSKTLWETWLGKADEEQLKRGRAAYEKGVDAWSKQFQQDQPAGDDELGRVSAKYESGGRGVGFVSSGQGDPGGPSYGVHQLSAKDSMPAFLRSPEGKKYAERLGGMSPWGADFRAEYQRIAAEDGAGLAKAQKDFYTRTHYKPALEAAKRAGFDTEDRGVQEAIFSIGVQHGGAQKIIGAASSQGDAGQQIRSLYAARRQYVAGVDLPPDTKQSVLNRYGPEERDALGLAGRRAQVATRALTGTPDDETGGGTVVPRSPIALPDRARISDHAINEFTSLLPKIDARLAKLADERAGREFVQGIQSGRLRMNKHDKEERDTVDKHVGQTDLGKKIFAGDPDAILQGSRITDRIGYMPKPVYEGLKGLMDDKDIARREAGYRMMGEALDRYPEAIAPHGDDKGISERVEHYRQLARLYGGQKALEIIDKEKTPEFKEQRKALKTDVDKIMKNYDGDKGASQIQSDMADGSVADWFSRPDVGFDPANKAVAVDRYRRILRQELEGGATEEKAKAMAASDLKRTYGVSTVFGGKRVVPYPMDRTFAGKATPEQLTADITKELDATQPGWQKGSVMVLGADDRTRKELDDWRKGLGRAPSYRVVFKRKDGREEMIRYYPDLPALAAKDADEFKAKREKALTPGTPEHQRKSDQETGAKIGDRMSEIIEAPVKAARDAVVREVEKGREEKAQGRDAGLEIQRNPGLRRTNPIDALTPKPRQPSVGGN